MVKKIYTQILSSPILMGLLIISFFQVNGQAQRALSDPNASPEAKALYCYMQSIYGKKILSGQMWASWGIDELAYIQTHTGKQPAMRGMDYMDANENNAETQRAIDWWKKGGIPTIMWHWGAPTKGDGYPASQLTIDINRCFTPGTAEYTAFWSELTKKADQLQKLRDANVPILWRPYHELNGGWFWWGKGNGTANETAANKAALFKKLWTTMYDYFVKDRKLNNLIWVLCYTGSPNGAWFPGNQYVDIAGADTYATGTGPQKSMYDAVKNNIGGNTMPIAYHECGTPPDPDQCLAQGAMWSWWMEWHTTHLEGVDRAYLKRVYEHDLVLTLDELPNFMTACGGTTNPTPTVTLTLTASSICVGSPITLSASASISSGSVSRVDFYDENTLLGTDNSNPYTYAWNGASAGAHMVRVIATSAANVASIAVASPLTVNALPIITPYMQVNAGTWAAQASAELCQGGSINIGPHPYDVATGWSWTGPGNFTSSVREISLANISLAQGGTYTASHTDANGCKSSSNMVVTVNANPVVSITSPANNSTVTSSPSNITINANVTGTGISNVQFYNGATLLGQDATAPYSYAWNGVPNGTYNLSVKATSATCVGSSATTSVTVSQVTSVSDNASTLGIECFPNPFHDSFTIKYLGDFSYVIYDATGLEVGKGNGSGQVVIGNHLHEGVYMVKVVTFKGNQLIKITK